MDLKMESKNILTALIPAVIRSTREEEVQLDLQLVREI